MLVIYLAFKDIPNSFFFILLLLFFLFLFDPPSDCFTQIYFINRLLTHFAVQLLKIILFSENIISAYICEMHIVIYLLTYLFIYIHVRCTYCVFHIIHWINKYVSENICRENNHALFTTAFIPAHIVPNIILEA